MTELVIVVVTAVVLVVLSRMIADHYGEARNTAPTAPAARTPEPVTPMPTVPGPPLRPRSDADADERVPAGESAARSASPPVAGAQTPRSGRTRLFGLGRIGGRGARHTGPYAVIGYQSTGFTPMRDRLVSLAVVHVDEHGRPHGHYATHLSAGPADLPTHLTDLADDIAQAPSFARVAPHLLKLLEGRVVVAHNAEFLEQFLDAHLMEAGILAPSLPALCTFATGPATFATLNHRLTTLASEVESPTSPGGGALQDAHATAAVLSVVLQRHGPSLVYPCTAAGDPAAVVLQPTRPPTSDVAGSDRWLRALFARASGLARELNDTRVARFVDTLVPVLLSGRIVVEEVRDLTRLMVTAGYSAAELRGIQERLLESLRRAAFEQGRIGSRGLHHLRATATSVGIPGYFDDLIPQAPPPAPEPGSGSFSRPVRKPLPPAPPAHLPRCGHCLEIGHYTSQCPRRELGPVRAIEPI